MLEKTYRERDFQALVDAKRFTSVLRSAEAGRVIVLTFPDGRSIDSFRNSVYRENARGENPIHFAVRVNYKNRTATMTTMTRDEYERGREVGLNP